MSELSNAEKKHFERQANALEAIADTLKDILRQLQEANRLNSGPGTRR